MLLGFHIELGWCRVWVLKVFLIFSVVRMSKYCKLCDFHASKFLNLMHSSFKIIIQGLEPLACCKYPPGYELACCSLAVIYIAFSVE